MIWYKMDRFEGYLAEKFPEYEFDVKCPPLDDMAKGGNTIRFWRLLKITYNEISKTAIGI